MIYKGVKKIFYSLKLQYNDNQEQDILIWRYCDDEIKYLKYEKFFERSK